MTRRPADIPHRTAELHAPNPLKAESGPEFYERLLVDHADRMVWIGKPGELATFGILHLALEDGEAFYRNRPDLRFEIRINRNTDTVRPCVVNEKAEAWPMGTSDLTLTEKIRRATPINDELTERRMAKLRGLLR